MKIKVSEATPLQLNWLVAVCEFPDPDYCDDDRLVYVTCELDYGMSTYAPSTNWAQGGLIIEREEIAQWPDSDGGWLASMNEGKGKDYHGPTPLIAAMRCYVANKLGDEVDVPEGLV